MKLKFQPRKAQGGFINGMLMIGIALMAVVVGAIAMAGSGSSNDITAQKTKTTAAVGMKRMADAVEAYQIYAVDHSLSEADTNAAANVPAMPKGFQGADADPVTFASKAFQVPEVATEVCAQINSVLGVETAPADFAAIGTLKEACAADGTYIRVVRD